MKILQDLEEQVRGMLERILKAPADKTVDFYAHRVARGVKRLQRDVTALSKAVTDSAFRIWKVKDLNKLPMGTEFIHQRFGRCSIDMKGGSKCMMFHERGIPPVGFNRDDHPWNVPMRLIHIDGIRVEL